MKQNRFYSNGKLLLTGEYLVLEGAKSLAVPTKFGQDLVVEKSETAGLQWTSFDEQGNCWFDGFFDLEKFRLENASYIDSEEKSEFISDTLMYVLQEARKLNPEFLKHENGLKVSTKMSFPRNWGLGSSSTFINNVAQWTKVDAYQLLWNAFSGSGYDIACAQNDTPILYQLGLRIEPSRNQKPIVESVNFNPNFLNELFFVHLNQKQDSREGIQRFKDKKGKIDKEIQRVSGISELILNVKNIYEFEQLLGEHENIISNIIELPKVQDQLFSDYAGVVKSLGAWGGDFVLATGNSVTPKYFHEKGFETVIPYSEMIL